MAGPEIGRGGLPAKPDISIGIRFRTRTQYPISLRPKGTFFRARVHEFSGQPWPWLKHTQRPWILQV
ncbi:hypothetical protein HanRHA438_Chr08g0353001 [Helianthus annuus]|nr:hypothetical protein HanIR_Chr08g0368761 [Helianthus annuus]KAJ0898099.1 hypothetical protein HanRHA438_Chr08g0353001 [Helianthus annuus]